MSIETILQKASEIEQKRNKRRVEVSQAVSAAADSLRETTEANLANMTEDEAILNLKTLSQNYDKNSPASSTIEQILEASQAVFEARGKRIIEVDQAAAAIATKIQEQAEADAANVDEDAAIAELKEMANAYSKEADEATNADGENGDE